MKTTLYPGSFDPITYGHMDVIAQTLKIYDKVIIGVLVNSKKGEGMFTFDERAEMIKKLYENNPRIEVISMQDNIAAVDVALNNNCDTMVRGLRDSTDFTDEVKLASLNLMISDNKVHTVAFFANPSKTTISSTMVKELLMLGKDISNFVPPIVESVLKNKIRSDNHEN